MTGRSKKPKGASSRPPISEETRTRMRLAKLGRRHTAEHNAKIAESMRAAHARGVHRAHSYLRALSEDERADYQVLVKAGRYRRADALRTIGRPDLIEPLKGWRKFLSEQEFAECRELRGRHGLGMAEALKALGRADLLAEAEARVSAPGGGAQS